MRDKSRRVLEIVELDRMENNEVIFNPLYVFKENSNTQQNKVDGCLQKVGELKHNEKIKAAGIIL